MEERIEWVTDPAGFAAMAEEWDRLAAAEAHPFSDHAWLQCWWSAFGGGAELRVCVARRGERLVAALPLARRGGRLFALANYHTPLFRPPAEDEDALRAVIAAALREPQGEVFFHALDASGAMPDELRAASPGLRRSLLVENAHTSPIVDIEGDFAAYEKRLGSTLRRRRRKLEREHEVRFRLEDGSGELERELRRGFEIEASGWKSGTGTAILSSPETVAFYTGIAAAYRDRGELRLTWLDVDDRALAFNLCLERQGRLYLIKTGFEESARDLAVGLVSHMRVVEHCFEAGLSAYELLGEAEPWKLRFSTSERRHVRAWAFRRRPLALARYLARRRAVPLARRLRALIRERGAGG